MTTVKMTQVQFSTEAGIFVFATTSRVQLLGHSHPLIPHAVRILQSEIKGPESEADHAPPPPISCDAYHHLSFTSSRLGGYAQYKEYVRIILKGI
jgi:hypothetical protein